MKNNIKVLTTKEMAWNLRVTPGSFRNNLKSGEYKDMPRFEVQNQDGIIMTRRFNSKSVINWLEETFNSNTK